MYIPYAGRRYFHMWFDVLCFAREFMHKIENPASKSAGEKFCSCAYTRNKVHDWNSSKNRNRHEEYFHFCTRLDLIKGQNLPNGRPSWELLIYLTKTKNGLKIKIKKILSR